jgi:hypothetical protein
MTIPRRPSDPSIRALPAPAVARPPVSTARTRRRSPRRSGLLLAALLALALAPGCAFHETAREWHGLSGSEGVPVYFTTTQKVALRAFIVIPLFGDTDIAGMVDELTTYVDEQGGDRMRIVQGTSENYWYGFPPLTWIFTPVVSTLSAVWEPPPELMEIDKKRMQEGWREPDWQSQ